MDDDYYKILGVSREATEADIQKAYRELARKYHPDMAEDKEAAKARFQEVQTAYDVLSDSEKREMYDRYGSSFESMAGGEGGPRWSGQAGPGGAQFDFNDIDFSQIFGGGGGAGAGGGGGGAGFEQIFRQFQGGGGGGGQRQRRQAPPRPGANLTHELTVSLKTIATGGEARLSLRRPSGKSETITVKIPAGIEDGKKIRLRGQGEPSTTGGPNGDILITIRVSPHPHFTRRGNDLEVELPVTLSEAALGAKVDVPTPKGTISLSIPAGTSSGKRLRLKGMGIQSANGTPGDLYAKVMIMLPSELDDESKQLIEKLGARAKGNPRADLSW